MKQVDISPSFSMLAFILFPHISSFLPVHTHLLLVILGCYLSLSRHYPMSFVPPFSNFSVSKWPFSPRSFLLHCHIHAFTYSLFLHVPVPSSSCLWFSLLVICPLSAGPYLTVFWSCPSHRLLYFNFFSLSSPSLFFNKIVNDLIKMHTVCKAWNVYAS